MNYIPATADEIDAAWLNDALADRHPGTRVAAVEIVDRNEVTNSHSRLRVSYEEASGAPSMMFCKLLPTDPARRPAVAGTGMGLREALFYEKLAPILSMRVPAVSVVRYDEGDGSFLLLMEDLITSGCTVSDGPTSVTPDAAARALEDMAELHVRFEDPVRRQTEAGWVTEPDSSNEYGLHLLQYGLDHHRDRLSSRFAEISELYIEKRLALHELWQAGANTVIHGDAHIGNLFNDGGRIGFLDWGLINLGPPLRDVSYFITMALSIDDRRSHERDLLRHYIGARRVRGGHAIDLDEAWRIHRILASYTVLASCQIVTFPENEPDRRRIFAEAFLARAEVAQEDLETREALRDLAGL